MSESSIAPKILKDVESDHKATTVITHSYSKKDYLWVFEYTETFYNTLCMHSHFVSLSSDENEELYFQSIERNGENLVS